LVVATRVTVSAASSRRCCPCARRRVARRRDFRFRLAAPRLLPSPSGGPIRRGRRAHCSPRSCGKRISSAGLLSARSMPKR